MPKVSHLQWYIEMPKHPDPYYRARWGNYFELSDHPTPDEIRKAFQEASDEAVRVLGARALKKDDAKS